MQGGGAGTKIGEIFAGARSGFKLQGQSQHLQGQNINFEKYKYFIVFGGGPIPSDFVPFL